MVGLLEYVTRGAMAFEAEVVAIMQNAKCTREEAEEIQRRFEQSLAPHIAIPENPYTLH